MEKSAIMHYLGKAAWLLTAIASIHVGAMVVIPFDAFSKLPESLMFLYMPIHVLYLVAGIYSLVTLFMHCGSCCE